MTNIAEALKFGRQLLQSLPDVDSGLEAQLLMSHLLKRDRSWLYAWPEHELDKDQAQEYIRLLNRRAEGMPIAYITGEREFWSLPFKVTEDTLIPRPETELIVSTILQLKDHRQPVTLLDLGTGSGAIAIAIASEAPSWSITATDASHKALSVAETNAARLGVSHIRFIHGDWFRALENNRKFHVIVSNPPYVAEDDDHLQQGDLRFEPSTALASGENGLLDLQRIIGQAADWLLPNGWLLVEHGMNQGDLVQNLFREAGFTEVSSKADYEQRDRITMGCRH